jgi:hypothetical protein
MPAPTTTNPYKLKTHVNPETASVSSVSIQGLSPGQVCAQINDQWAGSYVFLPTQTSVDGYPTGMVAVATGVTVS